MPDQHERLRGVLQAGQVGTQLCLIVVRVAVWVRRRGEGESTWTRSAALLSCSHGNV
jgi:hypothetical protein